MLDTRQRLKQLLDRDNITANLLAEISKVPAPTIYRFIKGDIGEPRSSTICKWAQVFKVSEAQMRGIDPIIGLDDIREVSAPMTLESVLTPDELIAIEGMRRHDKNVRRAWLLLGKELCNRVKMKATDTPDSERQNNGERRNGPITRTKYHRNKQAGWAAAESKKA